MAGQTVEAGYRMKEVRDHSEDGSDNPVDFGEDALGDSSYWYRVAGRIRASLYVDPDKEANGPNSADITVNGKRTLNAPSETIKAQATVAAGGAVFLDAENIEGYGYVQIKSSGTSGDVSELFLLLK